MTAGEQAAALLREGGAAWAHALGQAGGSALALGRTESALAAAARLEAGLDGTDRAALGHVARLLNNMFLYGLRERADLLLEHVQRLAGSTEDPELGAVLCQSRGIRARVTGEVGAQAELYERAGALFEQAGRRRPACMMHGNVGCALIELGRFADAEARLRTALFEAEHLGLPLVCMMTKQNLGWALARKGALEEARRTQQEAARFFAQSGDRRMEGGSRTYLARTALARGDLDAAQAEATKAVQIAEPGPLKTYALAALAEVHLRRNDRRGALALAQEARASFAAHGAEECEGYVMLVCAEAEREAGDANVACDLIRAARDRLLERAAKIIDPAWRESFLAAVSEHARTLALARQWLE
jgi:tetratricopeptide (TPR) repeat protein